MGLQRIKVGRIAGDQGMLSQRRNCKLGIGIFGLILIIGIGVVEASPVYAEETSTESEGLPGHRVGGGTRVGNF